MAKAKIEVEVAANFAKVTNQLQSIHKDFNKFASGLKNAFTGIGTVIAGALSVAALARFTKGLIDQADRLNEVSQMTGIAVKDLAMLGVVAENSGVDIEGLAKGLKFLSTNAVKTVQGVKESAESFTALGISVKDSGGTLKTTTELFSEVSDKFSKMQDGANKTALAVKIFGKAGMEMIPMLNTSKQEIQETITQLSKWGSINNDTAKNADALKDKVHLLVSGFKIMSTEIMGAALPAVLQIVDALLNFKKAAGDNQSIGQSLGVWIKALAMTFIELAAGADIAAQSMWAWGKGVRNIFLGIFTSKTLAEASEQFNTDFDKIKADLEKYKKLLEEFAKPPESTGGSGNRGGFTPDIVSDEAIKALQKYKDALKDIVYERQKLETIQSKISATPGADIDTTSAKITEQYNLIKSAGLDIDKASDAEKVKRILLEAGINAEMQKQIDYQKDFQKEVKGMAEAATSDLEKLNSQELKLNNAVAEGIITEQEWGKATAKIHKDMAAIYKAEQESVLALKMAELETLASEGDTSTLEIAKKKVTLLQEQLALHKERLTTMAKGTAEEVTAWNNEAEAMNQVSQELNAQIDIIKQYTSVWYGIKQGLKSYYEECMNLGDQLEQTVTDAFKGMEDALVEFVKTGKVNFKSLIDAMIADLARLMVKQAEGGIVGSLMSGLSSVFGGGGGYDYQSALGNLAYGGDSWSVKHAGGVVGYGSSPQRRLPHGFLSIAPRLHSGLASDEYPAILQKGETVLPRGYGGGSQPKIDIQIINQSKSEVSVKETSQSDGMAKIIFLVKDIVSKDISGGGLIHNSLRSAFGASPKVAGR
jgi:hypothetical protein